MVKIQLNQAKKILRHKTNKDKNKLKIKVKLKIKEEEKIRMEDLMKLHFKKYINHFYLYKKHRIIKMSQN